MVSAISGINSYYGIYRCPRLQGLGGVQAAYTQSSQLARSSQAAYAQSSQSAQEAAGVLSVRRGADPDTPVQPVRPVQSVDQDTPHPVITGMFNQTERYAAEMAVRMRIQYLDSAAEAGRFGSGKGALGVEDAQEAGEEGKCETCEKRKYQDGSDDMSVSFQTPTRIDPDSVAAMVRSHEMEHVAHEQARAQKEGRQVVSQSVTLHTGICPECGKSFVSGGTTRTVTKADPEPEVVQPEQKKAA